MGRRSLRRIDPSLDLSCHLKTLDQMPVPWDVSALFGRTAPLEIEIGSGKGLFLATASTSCPQHDFLGSEVSRKYARFAAGKLAKAMRSNALVLQGDARRLFHQLLPDECTVAIHVYFPDPWWKKRHKKRRILDATLLRHIERTLESGGALHFWTDVEEYFQTTVELIATATDLRGPFPVPQHDASHDLDYRTHFERRMRMHKMAIHRAEFRKG